METYRIHYIVHGSNEVKLCTVKAWTSNNALKVIFGKYDVPVTIVKISYAK